MKNLLTKFLKSEWYEEGENNKNEETELRINFLKNKINIDY